MPPKLTPEQQELVERERNLMEQEQVIQQLKSQLGQLQQQLSVHERERKRSHITGEELTSLLAARGKSEIVCYRAVGRAFLRKPAEKLIEEESETRRRAEEDIKNCEAKREQLVQTITKQQESFQVQYRELVAAVNK